MIDENAVDAEQAWARLAEALKEMAELRMEHDELRTSHDALVEKYESVKAHNKALTALCRLSIDCIHEDDTAFEPLKVLFVALTKRNA